MTVECADEPATSGSSLRWLSGRQSGYVPAFSLAVGESKPVGLLQQVVWLRNVVEFRFNV